MTHAFFKALLFLGAGSVIHAMSGQQDMRYMGGLKRHMPTTWWAVLVATLAIAGIPGLSGFFSKDEILWKSFASDYGSFWIWLVGLAAAGITAFYMFRLVFLAFYGQERVEPHTREHLHESPRVMTVPLVILAILSIVGGYVGFPHVLGGANHFEKFLEPVMHEAAGAPGGESVLASSGYSSSMEMIVMIGTTFLVLVFIYMAHHYYIKNTAAAERLRSRLSIMHGVLYGKYYIDELYGAVIVRPIVNGSLFLWKVFDVIVIDGLFNGLATLIGDISRGIRPVQSGALRSYTTIFLLGGVLIIAYVLYAGLR